MVQVPPSLPVVPEQYKETVIALYDDSVFHVYGLKNVMVCDVEERSSQISQGLLCLLQTRADHPHPDEERKIVGSEADDWFID